MKQTLITLFIFIIFNNNVFAQNQGLTASELKHIDSLVSSHLKSDTPGGAFAIVKNGNTIYKRSVGMASMESHVSISDSTLFNIASVSKQFTTFLALQLAEEGKLSFDDDIRTYLTELKDLPYKITIKQLTNHTHGLPNVDELAQLQRIAHMAHWQVTNMLLNITRGNFNPGNSYEYNNTGYVLLSEIIARVGKKPFQEQLKEKIFAPLQMKNTMAVGDDNQIVPNRATSYRLGRKGFYTLPVAYATMGSSGVYSSLNDLILWVKNYQHTTVGNTSFYQKMEKPTILESGEEVQYGLGLQFEKYKGIDIVFHGGGTEGYRAYILHVPKDDLSFVFLANDGSISGLDLTYGSLEVVLKNELTPEKAFISAQKKEHLRRFEGSYEIYPGNYFTTIAKEDGLYYQPFGTSDSYKMQQLAENTFTYPFIGYSNLTFYTDKVNLRIADFTYPSDKVVFDSPNAKDTDLSIFTGIYKNEEHTIFYELQIEDGNLIAKYNGDYDILLNPLSTSSFYSSAPFFGKIDFVYGASNQISGFRVSGQNLRDVVFKKIN